MPEESVLTHVPKLAAETTEPGTRRLRNTEDAEVNQATARPPEHTKSQMFLGLAFLQGIHM